MRPIHLEALGVVTVLIAVLILLNVHTAVLRFIGDGNRSKLFVFLGALVAVGGVLISLTYRVMDQVSDANSEISTAKDLDPSSQQDQQ